VSDNASVVKIYITTSSLVRFEIKNIFVSSLKNALAYVLQRSSKVVGLAPDE
jgi:hypothetical protein